MTPFQAAIIAMLTPITSGVVTLLGLYIKDLIDKQRLERVEKLRAAREKTAEEARAKRAQELAEELSRNTALTRHAVDRAEAAYTEANNFNGKLAETRQTIAETIGKQQGC